MIVTVLSKGEVRISMMVVVAILVNGPISFSLRHT